MLKIGKKPADELAVVLDTNILMRLLVHALVSPSGSVFSLLKKCRGTLWLAPGQEDEVFRNLHTIYDERMNAFSENVVASKTSIDKLIESMTFLSTIGACSEEDVKAVSQSKGLVQKLHVGEWKYSDLEELADKELAKAKHASDEARIAEAARNRVDVHNPPCTDKKRRSVGDCRIWELIVSLLEEGRIVWFSTADGDFCHRAPDLHPFLKREIRPHKENFRFMFERTTPNRAYEVLDALTARIGKVSAEVKAGVESSAAMRPDDEIDIHGVAGRPSAAQLEAVRASLMAEVLGTDWRQSATDAQGPFANILGATDIMRTSGALDGLLGASQAALGAFSAFQAAGPDYGAMEAFRAVQVAQPDYGPFAEFQRRQFPAVGIARILEQEEKNRKAMGVAYEIAAKMEKQREVSCEASKISESMEAAMPDVKRPRSQSQKKNKPSPGES